MPASPAPDTPPPVNYVLIDDENVSGLDLSSIEGKTVHVVLLLGPNKTKLPVEQVQELIQHAASAQLIRLEKAGKNALDFVLAFYLGRAVQMHPGAYFHLVSKDKGYDRLIEHLKSQHIRIHKHTDASALTFGQPSKPAEAPVPEASPTPEKAPKATAATPARRKLNSFAVSLTRLRKRGKNNPKTREKLIIDLKSHLGNEATDEQVKKVVLKLEKDGHVSFDEEDKVTYHLKKVTS